MKRNRTVGSLMIATISILGLVLFSCSNPLSDVIMNNSRSLEYFIPEEPDPIGSVDSPLSVPLLAGKTTNIGTVEVWIEDDMLCVSFNSTLKLVESQLDVVLDPADFPQTKKGNPKPGQFAYKTEHGLDVYTYTYQIPMTEFEEEDMLFFAAHAEVEKWIDGVYIKSEGAWASAYDFPGANWATYFAGAIPEPGPAYEDGSLMISFSGYFDGDGNSPYIGLFPHDSDPYDMNNILAIGGFDIIDGEGSGYMTEMTIEWQEFPPPWIGTGGELYDVYIWFDLNYNFDAKQYPEPEKDVTAKLFPHVVMIDGDVVLTITGDDMNPQPDYPYEDGTITVEISDYLEGETAWAVMGLYVHDSDTSDWTNLIGIGGFVIEGGMGSGYLSEMVPGGQQDPPPMIAPGGEIFDLYFWVDRNGNFNDLPYPEPDVDDVARTMPYIVFIDGDVLISLTGDDMENAYPF